MLALVLAPLAVGTSGHSVAGLLPYLAAATGTRAAWIGQLATVFALVCALAGPLLAVATGRWERRRLLTVCLVVTAAGNAVCAAAPSYAVLMGGRVVTALGAAMTTAVAVGIAAAASPPARRARAMAVVLAGLTLALLVGVPGVAAAAYHLGYRPALWSVAALCLLAAVVVAAAAPTLPAPPALGLRERLAVATRPGVAGVLAGGLLAWISTGAVYPYVSLVVGDAGQGVPVSLYLTVYGLGAAAGTIFGGDLVDRVGPRVPLLLATAGSAAALCLVVPALPSQAAGLVAVAVWGGCSWSTTPALNRWLDQLAPPGCSPLLLALAGSVIYLGMGLGGLLGGAVIAATDPRTLTLTAGALAALAFLLIAGTGRRCAPVGELRAPLPVGVMPQWPLR